MSLDYRNERLERIIGSNGLERLQHAHVMVVGLGGVGSNCAVALARGGIGNLVFVDYDVVCASNINRQAIALTSTIGMPKTQAMENLAKDINPSCHITTLNTRVNADSIDELFAHACIDFVIDAQDTVSTKLALAGYCEQKGIALISAMGAANRFDATALRFADIYETSIDPLCRIMRKEGRKRGIGKLKVIYSTEQPCTTRHDPKAKRNERANLGTMSYVPPVMGQLIAGETICTLLGRDGMRG